MSWKHIWVDSIAANAPGCRPGTHAGKHRRFKSFPAHWTEGVILPVRLTLESESDAEERREADGAVSRQRDGKPLYAVGGQPKNQSLTTEDV